MHYKSHSFRFSEDIYETLKVMKPGNLSWNQFFRKLLAKYEKIEKDKKKNI